MLDKFCREYGKFIIKWFCNIKYRMSKGCFERWEVIESNCFLVYLDVIIFVFWSVFFIWKIRVWVKYFGSEKFLLVCYLKLIWKVNELSMYIG